MAPVDDYYEILEISPTASTSDIKAAFRAQSLRFHPDRPEGNTAAFQRVQEAYQTLSDPNQRTIYDEDVRGKPQGSGRGRTAADAFENMFSGFSTGPRGPPRSGPPPKAQRKTKPSHCSIDITLEELYKGAEKVLNIERNRTCHGCSGSGAKKNTLRRQCVTCEGEGVTYATRVGGSYMQRNAVKCTSCEGTGSKIRPQDLCKKCHRKRVVREKHRATFYIERGLHIKDHLNLNGQGDESPDCTSPGDLIISFTLLPHRTFTLLPPSTSSASDLRTTLSLTLSESLLGFSSRLVLVHLDGRGLSASLPEPGRKGWRVLRHGDEVKIAGEGMWKSGEKGDLIVLIEVSQPDEAWAAALSPEKLALLTSLLPPKRHLDASMYPPETDEIDWEKIQPRPEAFSSTHEPGPRDTRYSDDEDDDEPQAPECQTM